MSERKRSFSSKGPGGSLRKGSRAPGHLYTITEIEKKSPFKERLEAETLSDEGLYELWNRVTSIGSKEAAKGSKEASTYSSRPRYRPRPSDPFPELITILDATLATHTTSDDIEQQKRRQTIERRGRIMSMEACIRNKVRMLGRATKLEATREAILFIREELPAFCPYLKDWEIREAAHLFLELLSEEMKLPRALG